MANTLTEVIPQLLAQGLAALREMAIMPLLVNRSYEEMAGKKGTTIDVPIPSAVSAVAVAPAITPPANSNSAPTSVPIELDQWYEAAFFLTDKEQLEVMEGHIPAQATEALKALANQVDSHILSLYKGVYGYHGNEAGSPLAHLTPFTDSSGDPTNANDMGRVRTILNRQLAPMDDRYLVMDPDAEGAALQLRGFQDASWSGTARAIIEGKLEKRLGFALFMDQNIPRHTAGTAAAKTDVTINGAHLAGVTSLLLAGPTGGTVLKGDILTIAGHSQTYVVTSTGPITLDASEAVSIQPALQVALAGSEAVDFKSSHRVNLAFHRDAIALATRPLASHGAQLGVISQSAVDPISGLALRVEVTHQHKQLRWSFDILWGAALVRPQLATRLGGA